MEQVQNRNPDNTQQNTFTIEDRNFIIAEFNIQREEILKRVELQHQLLLLTSLAFGTILTVGFQQSAYIILLYPLLAMFLSMAWAYNSRRVKEMQLYIAWYIETKEVFKEQNIGWERFRTKIQRGRHFDILTTLWEEAWGFFVGTQILAWLFGALAGLFGVPPIKTSFKPGEGFVWFLVGFIVLDFLSILYTLFILRPVKIKIEGQPYDVNDEKDLKKVPPKLHEFK